MEESEQERVQESTQERVPESVPKSEFEPEPVPKLRKPEFTLTYKRWLAEYEFLIEDMFYTLSNRTVGLMDHPDGLEAFKKFMYENSSKKGLRTHLVK